MALQTLHATLHDLATDAGHTAEEFAMKLLNHPEVSKVANMKVRDLAEKLVKGATESVMGGRGDCHCDMKGGSWWEDLGSGFLAGVTGGLVRVGTAKNHSSLGFLPLDSIVSEDKGFLSKVGIKGSDIAELAGHEKTAKGLKLTGNGSRNFIKEASHAIGKYVQSGVDNISVSDIIEGFAKAKAGTLKASDVAEMAGKTKEAQVLRLVGQGGANAGIRPWERPQQLLRGGPGSTIEGGLPRDLAGRVVDVEPMGMVGGKYRTGMVRPGQQTDYRMGRTIGYGKHHPPAYQVWSQDGSGAYDMKGMGFFQGFLSGLTLGIVPSGDKGVDSALPFGSSGWLTKAGVKPSHIAAITGNPVAAGAMATVGQGDKQCGEGLWADIKKRAKPIAAGLIGIAAAAAAASASRRRPVPPQAAAPRRDPCPDLLESEGIATSKDFRKWAVRGNHPDKGGDSQRFAIMSDCKDRYIGKGSAGSAPRNWVVADDGHYVTSRGSIVR